MERIRQQNQNHEFGSLTSFERVNPFKIKKKPPIPRGLAALEASCQKLKGAVEQPKTKQAVAPIIDVIKFISLKFLYEDSYLRISLEIVLSIIK